MLTLVSGKPVSKGEVNRSLDPCLIAKETTGDREPGFVFKHFYDVINTYVTRPLCLVESHMKMLTLEFSK